MNAKRWFAWLCLALMLVAEILLFRANHERDQAQTDLRDAQRQLREAQKQLTTLQNSSAGQQLDQITSLRKQNDLLTKEVNALQKNLDHAQAENRQNAQHLTTARTALELQQEHLQQLQAEQQQATLTADANACIASLHQIEVAKAQWALEKNKSATDTPTTQDLLPYLKDNIFPVCPDGGTYAINSMNDLPTCTISGHALPAQQ